MATGTSQTTREEDVLRLPPQAIEAEQSILGSMMLDNRVIDEISSEIEIRDFYRSDHPDKTWEHAYSLAEEE